MAQWLEVWLAGVAGSRRTRGRARCAGPRWLGAGPKWKWAGHCEQGRKVGEVT